MYHWCTCFLLSTHQINSLETLTWTFSKLINTICRLLNLTNVDGLLRLPLWSYIHLFYLWITNHKFDSLFFRNSKWTFQLWWIIIIHLKNGLKWRFISTLLQKRPYTISTASKVYALSCIYFIEHKVLHASCL